jgi:hypothetical protein
MADRGPPHGIEIGQRFERLTVIAHIGSNDKGQRLWACRCDCGRDIEATTAALNIGNVRSCGCLQREQASRIGRVTGPQNIKHRPPSQKLRGGDMRTAVKMHPCRGTCGKMIFPGEVYASIAAEIRGVHGTKSFCMSCYREREATRERRLIVLNDPTRSMRGSKNRSREVIDGVPNRIDIHLNAPRARMLREIMDWAGHERCQAILYNMIDAAYARWRARRDAGTLPKKPPPLGPKHYGPHLLKIGGFE